MTRSSMSLPVVWITALVSLLTVSANVVAPRAATRDLFVKNISVADPSRPEILTNQSLLIQDGVIVAMGNRDAMKAPRGAVKFDGTGKFLIPGLADMHVHLGEHSEVYNTLLVTSGVTRVRDMGGDIWRTHDIQQRIASGDLVGPDMTAAGPILENRRWLSIVRRNEPLDHRIPIGSVSEVRDVLDMVTPLGIDFVKIRNAPAPPIYSAIAQETASRGMKLVGHEPLVMGLADAFKTGQRSIEHVPWISLTRPGRDPSADEIDAIVKAAVAEGVYLTPTIVAMQARLVSTDDLRVRLAATDANPLMKYIAADHLDHWKQALDMRDTETGDLPWPSMIEKSIEYLREFHKAGVPIMTGTDFSVILVYPGWSVHTEMEFLVEQVNMTPKEAILAATYNPAAFQGVEDREGRIGVGMRANMVVLDHNPFMDIKNTLAISAVIQRGILLDKEKLESLKTWAQENKNLSPDYELTLDATLSTFVSSPSLEGAASLGRYFFAKGDYTQARQYFSKCGELSGNENAFLRAEFTATIDELYEGDGDCTILHELADRLLVGAGAAERLDIAGRVTHVAQARQCGETLGRYLAVVGELDPAQLPPESMYSYHDAMVNYMLRSKDDPAGALVHKRAILPSDWEADPAQLNNLAWWCFENTVALEEARGYAERAIEGAPTSTGKANAMDTLAEIVNALGDPSQAAEIMASAIELSDNEYLVKQLKRFRELADESVD